MMTLLFEHRGGDGGSSSGISETAIPALAVGLDEEELKPVPCDVADMSKGFSAWKSILRADFVELFCWG